MQFRGRTLYLIPGKARTEGDKFGDLYPVVALEHSGISVDDAFRLISSFINGVAWLKREPIRTAQFGSGSPVFRLGGQDARALVDDHFELNLVPEPAGEKAGIEEKFDAKAVKTTIYDRVRVEAASVGEGSGSIESRPRGVWVAPGPGRRSSRTIYSAAIRVSGPVSSFPGCRFRSIATRLRAAGR